MQNFDIVKIGKLIIMISNGNMIALEKLYKYTSSTFLIIAKYYLNDKSKACDVLSELYMSIVKYSTSFDGQKNGYNWMFSITKNLAFKQNKIDSVYTQDDDMATVACDDVDSTLNALLIDDAVNSLNDKDKYIIKSLYWEGLTLRELALKMEMPLTSLHREVKKIYFALKNKI